jgi:hypothetical protein
VMAKAKAMKKLNLGEMLEKEDAKSGLFMVAKEMTKKNRDVVGGQLRERCG